MEKTRWLRSVNAASSKVGGGYSFHSEGLQLAWVVALLHSGKQQATECARAFPCFMHMVMTYPGVN